MNRNIASEGIDRYLEERSKDDRNRIVSLVSELEDCYSNLSSIVNLLMNKTTNKISKKDFSDICQNMYAFKWYFSDERDASYSAAELKFKEKFCTKGN